MKIWLRGGGWISAAGHGRLGEGRGIALPPGPPILPPSREVFARRLPRLGRFDAATRLGCSCVALALQDAGLAESSADRPIGIVSSSRFECFETDAAYYQTALDEGGALASPNLFSYTVPGVMAGECAAHFLLTGPTFCVGEQGGRGMAALGCAMRLIEGGLAGTMLAGWLDAPLAAPEGGAPESGAPEAEPISGAMFVVLELATDGQAPPPKTLTLGPQKKITWSSGIIESLEDLFR